MTTLSEFLLARIAEDEEAIEEARQGGALIRTLTPSHLRYVALVFDSEYENITMSISRAVAECEANRQIVALHRPVAVFDFIDCAICTDPLGAGEVSASPNAWPCETLRTHALRYAGDPDYREEWKP